MAMKTFFISKGLIATDEDYRRVVETFGYHFLFQTTSVDTKKDQVRLLLATPV